MQDDIVLAQRVAVSPRDPAQRALESEVVERVDPAALAADEVMVMLAAGMSGLEARDALAEVDAMHEAQVGELVEHPVDARDSDGTAFRAQAVEELLRR